MIFFNTIPLLVLSHIRNCSCCLIPAFDRKKIDLLQLKNPFSNILVDVQSVAVWLTKCDQRSKAKLAMIASNRSGDRVRVEVKKGFLKTGLPVSPGSSGFLPSDVIF